MRHANFYRYFLGVRPNPLLRQTLVRIAAHAGQKMDPDLFHLTLCVIAEAEERDPFLLPRVRAALADQELCAFRVALGRVRGGRKGALVRTRGRQDEIQFFYRLLLRLLATRGIEPKHRKSGLHPHITLGHDACTFEPFKMAFDWFPDELLLIESEVGRTRHNVIGRWPLLPPRQGLLPLDEPAPAWRLAS
ncbi:hypothetical protein SCH01S_48_01500 [Sphingomonas changbaiensis NBRC 104936]|uniref:2'-5' RNA ligase n=2 Tax=Sphingomonas changbaiensis TaxID=529705 RepID=A0A0E9MSF2_9SPHN|nr:hypothetical protein SCH01S_48_01500 [Sphingomonas changbaiensis NBRC 104936]